MGAGLQGKLLLKPDSHLTVDVSVKARGSIHEIRARAPFDVLKAVVHLQGSFRKHGQLRPAAWPCRPARPEKVMECRFFETRKTGFYYKCNLCFSKVDVLKNFKR